MGLLVMGRRQGGAARACPTSEARRDSWEVARGGSYAAPRGLAGLQVERHDVQVRHSLLRCERHSLHLRCQIQIKLHTKLASLLWVLRRKKGGGG